MSECTLFTSTKPFVGHDCIVQRNALNNWRALGLRCIIFGNDAGAAEAAREFGFQHIPEIATTEHGTPLLSDMFEQAQAAAFTSLVGYINADILLPLSFITAVNAASQRWERFLMVGQRWDVDVLSEISFKPGWSEAFERLRIRGKLHSPWGIDYFVFPRGTVRHMLPFAIGRPGWDNWLIWTLSANGIPMLNVTQGAPVVHQNHEYKHVPGGRGSYSGPEGDVNLRMSVEHSPDLNPAYASVYRAEWTFDGSGIKLDESWGRWWWYTKHKFKRDLLALIRTCFLRMLFKVLGPEKYIALKNKYRQMRGMRVDDVGQ